MNTRLRPDLVKKYKATLAKLKKKKEKKKKTKEDYWEEYICK